MIATSTLAYTPTCTMRKGRERNRAGTQRKRKPVPGSNRGRGTTRRAVAHNTRAQTHTWFDTTHTPHTHIFTRARVARTLAQARARDQRPNSRFSRGIWHIASPCLEGAKAKSQPAMKTVHVENAGIKPPDSRSARRIQRDSRWIQRIRAGISGIHAGISDLAGFSGIHADSAGFTRIHADSRWIHALRFGRCPPSEASGRGCLEVSGLWW